MNPQAQPCAFPSADNPEVAAYLTEKTENDPATGCLLWTGGVNKQGDPRIWKTHAARFGSDRPARLAWQLCHGKTLGKMTKLVPTCGNPRCINPEHLREAAPATRQRRRKEGLSNVRAFSAGGHSFVNPHAKPYAFPEGKHDELVAYLTEMTAYDPATGCLEWTGSFERDGQPAMWKGRSAQFGTRRPARLAWQLGHGRKLDKGASLVRTCGNPKCIHPHHLREATPADLWRGEDGMEPKRQGSVGSLKLGRRILHAQEVYQIQSMPPPRDPRLGLRSVFYWQVCWPVPLHAQPRQHQRERLEIIRAVRRCPIRASRTVLPCGFIRYDLPAGITEIAFTELPPPSYEDVFGWQDEPDEVPETAEEADWAITAKAA